MNTTTNSKCSNLGIVMECAEVSEENHERQALLMDETNKSSATVTSQSLDKMKKEENDKTPKTQQQWDKAVTVHELDDGNGGRSKKRVAPPHHSRVERSRLSLITFLNNITAPPIRMESNASSGKTRSQSISISSPTHSQIATTTDSELTAAASYPPVQAIDKLSIKSSVSMAASSNSGPSESMFSAGSGTSLSCSKAAAKHRECPICCVRQSAGNFQKLKCCPHLTCKTCLIKYLTTEIMESRTNISCPECPAQLHASDIYALLANQPELIDRFELFALRRALSTDPDTRWCPAPDCIYAVIAQSCAACPQLKCERCSTMFCYHCKNTWHPSQTCDQARSKSFFNNHPPVVRASLQNETAENDVMKACPRCGALIMKMNDGSCNHMQCALCNTEFCWLCLKQINELHYLSPTGCTFWGKKPWTRKKKLLWQIGTLIGAPLGIALIAGLAVPGIICGVPIFVGRKTYQRFSNLTRTKRQLVTAMSVVGSLLVSPVLAVMAVGVGVPIMLAYVYGVVPLSLCRNGACGGSNNGDGGNDEEVAYGEEVLVLNPNANHIRQSEEKSSKLPFHHRRQSIASSGLASLGDKPNTEDASIAAIAGSQYNYDNRSVHTIWSSGQYAGHISETTQEATSYNNDDVENASTMACCSASIVARAERRSLTGSNDGSFKTRPRSSISNSRATSEEPGRIPAGGKLMRKGGTTKMNLTDYTNANMDQPNARKMTIDTTSVTFLQHSSSIGGGPSHQAISIDEGISSTATTTSKMGPKKEKKRFSFQSFIRHPVDTILPKKRNSNAGRGGTDGDA